MGDRPSTPEARPNASSSEGRRANAESRRHYSPRTCRICLETVLPSFQPAPTHLPGILNPGPSVEYISSDPDSGRLIRPCKCKGSSRYVHEGCLQAWRHADPGYSKRNYWQCPTCGFRYRLERMNWGNWISSAAAQLILTCFILMTTMFFLGFIADPIINLYLDPYDTITSFSLRRTRVDIDYLLAEDRASWSEHFIKGLASLGLLSFVKVIFAMSPWQWWNLRSTGLVGGSSRTAAGSGRDRLASISWLVVLIGVTTFLWGVYKGVRAFSRRMLERASERVMDVQEDDDAEEIYDKASVTGETATDE